MTQPWIPFNERKPVEMVRVDLLDRNEAVQECWFVRADKASDWVSAQEAPHQDDGWSCRVTPLPPHIPFVSPGGFDA